MRLVAARIRSLVLAGVATCAVATCHHDVPVVQPPMREAPPIGSRPEPLRPEAPIGTAPTTGGVTDPAPACGEDQPCHLDGGLPSPATLSPATSQLELPAVPRARIPAQDVDAVRASVAPRKPPVDAGPDGPLPPVPDATIPLIRDAGTPMQ